MNTPPLKFYYALIRMALPMAVLFLYLSHDAQGQYSGTGTFAKITSVAELTDGYYVITNETDEFLMTNGRTEGNFYSSANSGATEGVITNPSTANVWKIETNANGRTIYNENISRYVGWSSGNTATAVTTVNNNSSWTFTYASSKWTVNNVDNAIYQLSYNNTHPRFAAYGNTQQHELQLYKFADPTILVYSSSLTGMGYEEFSPTSPSQSFSLSAYNLDPATGSLSLDAPAFFELSTNDVNFSDNLTLPYTEGALEATNIYVRIKENMEVSNYFGNIAITGGGADAVNLPVEGEVWEYSDQCGFEDFNNSNLPSSSSYGDGSFVGNDEVTWTYGHSRNEDTFSIDGKGIMLRRASDSYLEATLPAGVGTFSFDYRKAYTGSSARQLELIVNGVQVATTPVFGDESGEDPTVHHFTHMVNQIGPVTIKIKNIGSTSTNRQTVLDNIAWTCFAGCESGQQITDFHPLRGPANTKISILGSGFTGATGVTVGGIPAASFVVIDDALIEAEISETGWSGKIGVLDADGCEQLSQEDFEFLTHNANCAPLSYATDLFISEVYDAATGSVGYIEVFNGTANSVDLTDYKIVINTGSSATIDLTGTLNSGDTYIVMVGEVESGQSCEGITPDLQGESWGYNGNDEITLQYDDAVIDHVPNPENGAGFSQVRKATVTSPNAVYDENEWIITNQPNCDHLGIGPYGPYMPDGNNVIINTHPVDVYCDDLVLTVDATLIQGGTMDFTWRYNAPGEPDWSLVSSLNGNNGLTVTGSGTNTITISGAVSTLYGYQFYVDVESGGTNECIRQSHVAKYSFDTKFYYQTKDNTDGNWSDVDNWEMSDGESGPWTDACNYPFDLISGKITIRSGHTVNLDVAVAIDHVIIEENATLSLPSSRKLTVHDGNPEGPDLVVNGTLIDNGSTQYGIGYSDIGNPTWALGSNASVIKTNTSSVARYRDNYHGGIENIPADAHWIYRYTDGSSDVSVVTLNMYYPNLSFENEVAGGNYDPTNNLYIFSGNSPVVIKGDLNIGMSGAGTYSVKSVAGSLIQVQGNLNIGSDSQFRNGDGTNTGEGLEVFGDILVQGSLDMEDGELHLYGHFLRYGNFTGLQSTIYFKGSTDQNFGHPDYNGYPEDGNSTTTFFSGLIMDKPGGKLYITDRFVIDMRLDFTENGGIIVLDESMAEFSGGIEMSIGSTTSGASNAGFVVGKMRKLSHSADETDISFTFPIGDTTETGNAWYQPVRISVDATSQMNGTYDAQYFAHAHPEAGTYYNGQPYNNGDIGKCDHWVVTKELGDDVQLAFKYTNEEDEYCNDVDVPADLDLARWNGLEWDDIADDHSEIEHGWIKTGIDGPTTVYGVFAFASTNNANVLPIELLEFSARPDGGAVMTHWATATETNNDYFTVERSDDGMDFHPVGTVVGAGHSTVRREYRFRDLHPLSGVSYYRLRQTDFDGGYSFGPVRAVKLDDHGAFGIEQVYRGEGGIELFYRSPAPMVEIEIFNVLGQRVFHVSEENRNGQSRIAATLERGVYLLRLRDSNGNAESRKFFY